MRRMAVEIEPADMDLGAALSICTSLDSSGKLPSAFAAWEGFQYASRDYNKARAPKEASSQH
jgi:hypothetical protein